ncbi:GNAT family N-acetyltransferase [Streptomyces sp. NPDC057460]|uniref:GNAT family N-acetyltransferase n=1 Tax=Streptomyces sp. NPDC057460 TaxID=3346141 RepID=UPI0036D0918D
MASASAASSGLYRSRSTGAAVAVLIRGASRAVRHCRAGELGAGPCAACVRGSDLHLYRLIVARRAAGRLLGARLVDWASNLAALEGREWVRIDTWRSNSGLHSYYERLGFEHIRTETPSHRRSGWLAQRAVGTPSLPNAPLRVGIPAQRVTPPDLKG